MDIWLEVNSQLELDDLGEDPVVVELISVLAAKKVKLPKLMKIERVYEWIDNIKETVEISGGFNIKEGHLAWGMLARQTIDEAQTSVTLTEFRDLLYVHPAPGRVNVPVRPMVNGRNRTTEEIEAKAIITSPGQILTTYDGEGDDVIIERPVFVWEWLTSFVNEIWLTRARCGEYRSHLEAMKYVPAANGEGLTAALSALTAHDNEMRRYCKMAKVINDEEKLRLIRNSFKNHPAIYTEILKANSWAEVIQYGKIMVEGNCNRSAPQVNAVEAINRPDADCKELLSGLRAMIEEIATAQKGLSRPWANRREGGGGGPIRGRANEKKTFDKKNRTPMAKKTDNRMCYHCTKLGHMKSACPSGKEKATMPPKPDDVLWADHCKAVRASLTK